jgi:hypothetical protein
MDRFPAEQALSRVHDYLSAMGIEITREVTVQILQLVEAGFASEQEDPLHFIITRLDECFPLPKPNLPSAYPPIIRGSMGYEAQ